MIKHALMYTHVACFFIVRSWTPCPKMTLSSLPRSRWRPCRSWKADVQVAIKACVFYFTLWLFGQWWPHVQHFSFQSWKKKLSPSNNNPKAITAVQTPFWYRFVYRAVSYHLSSISISLLTCSKITPGTDWKDGCPIAGESRNSAKSDTVSQRSWAQ